MVQTVENKMLQSETSNIHQKMLREKPVFKTNIMYWVVVGCFMYIYEGRLRELPRLHFIYLTVTQGTRYSLSEPGPLFSHI